MEWVLIVDDEATNLKIADRVLSRSGIRVTALESGQAMLDFLKENAPSTPDLILLDTMMPGMDGFETLAKIRRFYPDARVLLLAGMPTVEEVERARKAGAAGYMSKSARIEQLSEAVQEVANDPSFFAEDSFVPTPSILSPRETDVLRLLAQGLSREQIAEKLCISPETVKSRAKTMMIKLDVSNSAGAVHRGHELGILRA